MPLTKKNYHKQEEPEITPTEPVVSQSQQKRESIMKEADTKTKLVKVKMFYDYRNEAKSGDIYETDPEKAAQLVRLRRAEYVK